MTDRTVPAWLREEAEKIQGKVKALFARAEQSRRFGPAACRAAVTDELASFALRVGERLAQEQAKLYHDLLFQVATKHPNETRHETARRYLRTHEEHCGKGGPVEAAARGEEAQDTPPTPYETGLCCMSAHAQAKAPWTCDCPCHRLHEAAARGEERPR